MYPSRPGRQRGLTLVELMITTAIIAIVALIAWNQYDQQAAKNRRTDAIRALLAAQVAMEQYRSDNGTYDDGAGGATALGNYMQNAPGSAAGSNPDDCGRNRGYMATAGGGFVSCRGYYNIAVTNLTASTYTLQATPAMFTSGSQQDKRCPDFTLTHTGIKSYAGTPVTGLGGSETKESRARECWAQ